MRLALTAGGTGGHIIPALAVLDALQSRAAVTEVCFFGPEDRGERAAVEARGLRFEPVSAAAIRGRGPLRLARSFARLSWGTVVALRKLRAFRPDVVFSTGGYASFPCSVAARILRYPLVVYLPDVVPGWAVRAEKRLATRMATTTVAALRHLPARKTAVTGYPVRSVFFSTSREHARAALGLPAEDRAILVTGATQGARALNRAIFDSIEEILRSAVVFHVTGPADFAEAQSIASGLNGDVRDRYRPADYRDDLPTVMLAADLAVMRAGASTLGELPAAGLPAILVPALYAGGHQRDNARWLVDGGAAVILEERDLGSLCQRLNELLGDPARLTAMKEAAHRLARPGAADAIADLILEVARK